MSRSTSPSYLDDSITFTPPEPFLHSPPSPFRHPSRSRRSSQGSSDSELFEDDSEEFIFSDEYSESEEDSVDWDVEFDRQMEKLKVTVFTILIPLWAKFLGRKIAFAVFPSWIRRFFP